MLKSCWSSVASRSTTSPSTGGCSGSLRCWPTRPGSAATPGDRWYCDETHVKINGVWRDHSQLKHRLRAMRGLCTDPTAQVIITGHAFVQNLRRGHYELSAYAGCPSTTRVRSGTGGSSPATSPTVSDNTCSVALISPSGSTTGPQPYPTGYSHALTAST